MISPVGSYQSPHKQPTRWERLRVYFRHLPRMYQIGYLTIVSVLLVLVSIWTFAPGILQRTRQWVGGNVFITQDTRGVKEVYVCTENGWTLETNLTQQVQQETLTLTPSLYEDAKKYIVGQTVSNISPEDLIIDITLDNTNCQTACGTYHDGLFYDDASGTTISALDTELCADGANLVPDTLMFDISTGWKWQCGVRDSNVFGLCSAEVGYCGDTIVQIGEECDDGNDSDTDTCTSMCKKNICGDESIRVGHEECDDGNNQPGDGCYQCAREIVDQCLYETVVAKAGFDTDGLMYRTYADSITSTARTYALDNIGLPSSCDVAKEELLKQLCGGTYTSADIVIADCTIDTTRVEIAIEGDIQCCEGGVCQQGQIGSACTTSYGGTCSAGIQVCTSTGVWSCIPENQHLNIQEQCDDGIDNNCNGNIDEGCIDMPFICEYPIEYTNYAGKLGDYTNGTATWKYRDMDNATVSPEYYNEPIGSHPTSCEQAKHILAQLICGSKMYDASNFSVIDCNIDQNNTYEIYAEGDLICCTDGICEDSNTMAGSGLGYCRQDEYWSTGVPSMPQCSSFTDCGGEHCMYPCYDSVGNDYPQYECAIADMSPYLTAHVVGLPIGYTSSAAIHICETALGIGATCGSSCEETELCTDAEKIDTNDDGEVDTCCQDGAVPMDMNGDGIPDMCNKQMGQCHGEVDCTGWTFHFAHALTTDAYITIYDDGTGILVGSGFASMSNNPFTDVSGNWLSPPTPGGTVTFHISYGGGIRYITYIVPNGCCPDSDGDGVCASDDCDDTDPTIYPGAIEICDDIDNDCDGAIDEGGVCDSCPPVPDCALPPLGCAWSGSQYDASGCMIGCGELVCSDGTCTGTLPAGASICSGSTDVPYGESYPWTATDTCTTFATDYCTYLCMEGYMVENGMCVVYEDDDEHGSGDDPDNDFPYGGNNSCGDGIVRNFEQCDDGNGIDGDGCDHNCMIEYSHDNDLFSTPREKLSEHLQYAIARLESVCAYDDVNYQDIMFRDVKREPEHEAINTLLAYCIVKGYDRTYRQKFHIDAATSKAELIKVMAKTLGMDDGIRFNEDAYITDDLPYKDIRPNHWYASYVVYADQIGILDYIGKQTILGTYLKALTPVSKAEFKRMLKNVGVHKKYTILESPGKYIYREDMANIIVDAFADKFKDYRYLYGNNIAIYKYLLQTLEGKSAEDQVRFVRVLIERLDDFDHLQVGQALNIHLEGLIAFLQLLVDEVS